MSLLIKQKEDKGFQEELKEEIINQLIPKYNKVRKILSVEDLREFATHIIETGKKNKVPAFEKYGTDLLSLIKALQFDKILQHLPTFNDMVNIVSQ